MCLIKNYLVLFDVKYISYYFYMDDCETSYHNYMAKLSLKKMTLGYYFVKT